MPRINWLMCFLVVVTTIMFQSSGKLAVAYGVSVTSALVIDSLMAFFVIWRCWKWSLAKTVAP